MNMRNQARRIVTMPEEKIQEIRLTCTLSQLRKKRFSAFASRQNHDATREIYVDYYNVSNR